MSDLNLVFYITPHCVCMSPNEEFIKVKKRKRERERERESHHRQLGDSPCLSAEGGVPR